MNDDEVGLADLPGDLPALEEAFALTGVSAVQHLPDGWMNRNWKLTAGPEQYVLKRLLDIPPATARAVFAAVRVLASRSVPVCIPVRSVGGETVVELAGRAYCLLPWVDGVHRDGRVLSVPRVADLGRLVARIHQALADLPDDCGLPLVPATLGVKVAEVDAAVELITRIEQVIEAIAVPTPYDLTVQRLLRRRRRLLKENAHRRPALTAPASRFGRIHGDLNIRNLLWRGEKVVAVLDWDRMRAGFYADEVVRTAQVLFGSETGVLDLERVSVFAAAYRSVTPVTAAELAEAAHRLWWKRLTDVWPVEFRYLRGDPSERIAALFPPGEQTLEWWTARLDDATRAFAGQR